jgi:2-oxoglutarate dehydrogenase dihydrolipoamide succinyltransferase (E2 component)
LSENWIDLCLLSKGVFMATKVIMPQLGESVVEGTVTKWLKAKGEVITELEPLLEINTDKVDTEIPCPSSGTLLEILVEEGNTVTAGTVLAWIGDPGETLPEIEEAPSAIAVTQNEQEGLPAGAINAQFPDSRKEQAPRSLAGHIAPDLGFISPVVAKLAQEHAIDLNQVPGSGYAGRITKKDVLAYLDERDKGLLEEIPPQPAWETPADGDLFRPTEMVFDKLEGTPKPTRTLPAQSGEVIPLTPVRRLTAEHMIASKHISPHVSTIMEVDLRKVVAHRQANKDAFAKNNANLTYSAYFTAASVAALKIFRLVNSSWSDEGIVVHPSINIGIATSLGDAGLIVPVIKNTEGLSLLGIARAINDLANRARGRMLKPEEVKGGTFTITNHGVSGSLFATPIINQPQCAILGVGAIQKRVVVIEEPDGGEVIAIRPMAYLSLTFDHRILDGASADAFLGKVVEILQDWN